MASVGSDRDPAFIERARTVLELFASYYRPEVRGFETLPARGPFLLVGNHNGGATSPDLPILMTAWWRERGVDEPVYGLFHSGLLRLPLLGDLVRRAGALEAGHGDAEAVLNQGGIVIVFPGGDHEATRTWRDRHRIDFGGRSGFVRLALRTGVPVVPVVSCGAHDSTFIVSRGEWLARRIPTLRMWRMKTFPIQIGPPLPTRTSVQIGPPFEWPGHHTAADAEDDNVVEACYRQTVETMQATMDQLAAERRSRSG